MQWQVAMTNQRGCCEAIFGDKESAPFLKFYRGKSHNKLKIHQTEQGAHFKCTTAFAQFEDRRSRIARDGDNQAIICEAFDFS